ncbi:MAG: phosphatidylserine decarboxylase [Kiritimatiellae bacterium]|nr:phosphatidylserine decarboxylase [Kiritimatiellia bacterium]
MRIVRDGWSWILGTALSLGGVASVFSAMGWQLPGIVLGVCAVVLTGFMVYFFRDPERMTSAGSEDILSGADGWVRSVEALPNHPALGGDAVRISIFLTPFNVHVNRCPIGGVVEHAEYRPGRKLLTLDPRASEVNEHSLIRIADGPRRCAVRQIVGPVVRRVVYWLKMGETVTAGQRLGLMKFGSRLDVYLPDGTVEVLVRRHDRVRAGRSVIARWRKE